MSKNTEMQKKILGIMFALIALTFIVIYLTSNNRLALSPSQCEFSESSQIIGDGVASKLLENDISGLSPNFENLKVECQRVFSAVPDSEISRLKSRAEDSAKFDCGLKSNERNAGVLCGTGCSPKTSITSCEINLQSNCFAETTPITGTENLVQCWITCLAKAEATTTISCQDA